MDDAFNKQAATGGASELDEVKRMLTETNPILLITTLIVSLLHTLSVYSPIWSSHLPGISFSLYRDGQL
jgi:Cleft lip and palate transmembrane protein 1 (CLPTM1)